MPPARGSTPHLPTYAVLHDAPPIATSQRARIQAETQETDTNKDTTDETFLRDAYG